MPDSKISALTGATTPLAGTEELPIVQSGATKKVTVANLTAGRAVSASSLTGDSVIFGTQTNKATLSYATNTARTLTVPNVGGNRTFAFIDEAQTFSTTQTFVETFGLDATGGSAASAEITRSINAGYALASARGNWIRAVSSGGAQYSAFRNNTNNDYIVWDLVLENCSQIVCDLSANNNADGTSRTMSSEYSTDSGTTWTALGSATFGSSGGTPFGGTITFNAPRGLIYLKVRAFWASGATSSALIGIRSVSFTPTCTNHSFANSLG